MEFLVLLKIKRMEKLDMSDDVNIYFECQCYSPEHMLKFTFIPDERCPEDALYTSVYLRQHRSWYKRLWIAVKYIFGYKTSYGDFDCFSMKPEDADKFYNLAKKYKEFVDNTK